MFITSRNGGDEIHRKKINLSYFVSFRVFLGLNKTAEVKINSGNSLPLVDKPPSGIQCSMFIIQNNPER